MEKISKLNISKSNKIKIISIDVANKSLAIACLEYNCNQKSIIDILDRISKFAINPNADFSCIIAILNDLIYHLKHYKEVSIVNLTVADLFPNILLKNTKIIERVLALNKYLNQFCIQHNDWIDADTHLIVEYQMGPNRKSGDVQMQILYHFANILKPTNIHIIGPSLKNKLCGKDPKTHHSYHIQKYKTLYTANKAHTKYIFLQHLKLTNQFDKISKINKKNYADIADAYCQAIAWINHLQ